MPSTEVSIASTNTDNHHKQLVLGRSEWQDLLHELSSVSEHILMATKSTIDNTTKNKTLLPVIHVF